jgi:hypothetical protein
MAYREINCAPALQPVSRPGSLIIPNRETVHRRAGSRKRSSTNLALPSDRSRLGRRRQDSGRELVDAFEDLAEAPGKGHRRPDLTKRDVLFFTEYQYMIVYRRAATFRLSQFYLASATQSGSSKRGYHDDRKTSHDGPSH